MSEKELEDKVNDACATLFCMGQDWRKGNGSASKVDSIADSLIAFLKQYGNIRELEGRIDEREGMQFFDQQTFEETHRPYLEYRFTGDGLKLSWEDRTKELESQKEKTQ